MVNVVQLRAYSDGQELRFTEGNFDNYRVDFSGPEPYPCGHQTPTDIDFFQYFLTYEDKEKIWEAVLQIASQISANTTDLSGFTAPQVNGGLTEQKMFDAYAAALIAEERKAYTHLGKKIKLIGAYQVLRTGMSPEQAANFSKGKKAKELLALYDEYYGLTNP